MGSKSQHGSDQVQHVGCTLNTTKDQFLWVNQVGSVHGVHESVDECHTHLEHDCERSVAVYPLDTTKVELFGVKHRALLHEYICVHKPAHPLRFAFGSRRNQRVPVAHTRHRSA